MSGETPPDASPTAGAFHGREHHLPIRVYYEDTDFTGVVYHAGYLRFFERGRSDFLRLVGGAHAGLLDLDPPLAFAVSRMTLAFKAPARIDDALTVVTAYQAVRGARFHVAHRLRRGPQVLATAEVEVASIDLKGRPRRLPAALTARLQPYLAPGGETATP